MLQLHSLVDDAKGNEAFYRDMNGPGKICCADLSYFHEAILLVVAGLEDRVYYSESLDYSPGMHAPTLKRKT